MSWKDPKKELPEDNKEIAILIEPHKMRGNIKASIQSVIIYFGVTHMGRVENSDELGLGSVAWYFNRHDQEESIAAWQYVEDMDLPKF